MSEDSSTSSTKKPNLPRHIAIIMDGNGRWAKNRLMPRFAGHKAGVEAVRSVVENCARKGVEVLTLFAFSSENWRRPAKEVGLLMELHQLVEFLIIVPGFIQILMKELIFGIV